ncbi:GrpB family protein [Candidatus Daviesbacteria bacterium]|nr:GrpB family protein [Candidatus Daviesbacteria bacterium]
MKKYVFKPYDPNFPKLFELEKNRLRKILGKDDLIEHIGSTAVPGLGGKGIIDICIATSKKNLKAISKKLQEIGYEFGPKGGSKERLFHKISLKDENKKLRTYHVHLTFKGSQEWDNVTLFRDYLGTHPKEAKKYAEIKKFAVKKANENREVYIKIKSPLIDEMVNKALKVNENNR